MIINSMNSKEGINIAVLNQIADRNLLRGLFCKEAGLWDGKMGMCLFFFLYARHTGNIWYEEFGGELLDDVCCGLSLRTPITFADGLCGIGWGIEFLKAKGFIEGNTDEILYEVDRLVMEKNVCRMTDYSLETGLEGIVAYVQSRLAGLRLSGFGLPFDPAYLMEVDRACREAGIDRTSEKYTLYAVWDSVMQYFAKNHRDWQNGLTILYKNCL